MTTVVTFPRLSLCGWKPGSGPGPRLLRNCIRPWALLQTPGGHQSFANQYTSPRIDVVDLTRVSGT